jgi:hypothetical protein
MHAAAASSSSTAWSDISYAALVTAAPDYESSSHRTEHMAAILCDVHRTNLQTESCIQDYCPMLHSKAEAMWRIVNHHMRQLRTSKPTSLRKSTAPGTAATRDWKAALPRLMDLHTEQAETAHANNNYDVKQTRHQCLCWWYIKHRQVRPLKHLPTDCSRPTAPSVCVAHPTPLHLNLSSSGARATLPMYLSMVPAAVLKA